MQDIYIIGASGFGREVAWLIEELDEWNIKGFIDDNEDVINQSINGYLVLGNTDYLLLIKENINTVIAIAKPAIREKIFNKLKKSKHINFPNIIAKDIRIADTISLGKGNIICKNAVLTTNIVIGNFNHINISCTIGHDATLGDFITAYPPANIAGNVNINKLVEIGTGTQIIQGKTICNNVIIGAGSVVIKDIVRSGTYVGIPARRIK